MPLLLDTEYSPEALMADVALQRAASNQLTMQLIVLQEGINLPLSPTISPRLQSPTRYIVGDGETLPRVSTRIYGAPDRWSVIAEANDLDYPYTITPGQVLVIPNV